MHITDILAALPLDRDAATPLFRQLYEQVKSAILRGAITSGMQLPPTRTLCELLSVSRQTVLNAYDLLTAEGYLSGSVGRGTFISSNLPITRPRPKPSKTLLRPLSARGMAFHDAMGAPTHHNGPLRAFRVGMPGIDHFPFDQWSRLEARRWRRPDYHLGYGDPAGYRPLRELLCVYLKASRGVNCVPEQIVITSGSQQALFLLSTILLDPGDAAWVESPGYRGASGPLYAGGAKVFHVPLDDEGIDVAYGATHCPKAKLVCVTPSHQLPLGVCMSLQRRLALLEWAAANKAWVIEDDYDSEYRYTGPPLASLQSLDRADCTVYVGTLSKVLFPGLRLGYLVAPQALVDPLVRAKAVTDRHTSIVPQMVLADFIAGGHFSRHIKRTREVNAERRAILLDAVQGKLAEHLQWRPSETGLELCVHFRRKLKEAAIIQAGLEQGIELRGLSHYADAGAGKRCAVPPGLILGFASIKPPELRQGIDVLARILDRA